MADWDELAADSLKAANELLRSGRYRSCISRAYYAAYAAVTAKLEVVKGARQAFRHPGPNPSHGQVVGMMESLGQLGYGSQQIRSMKQAIRLLGRLRTVADYCPGLSVARDDARMCRRAAGFVAKTLERRSL